MNIASSACARWLTCILSLDGRFAEGAAERFVVKQRIVAEAVRGRAASSRMRPSTEPRNVCTTFAVLHQRDHAHESRRAIRDAAQPLQQQRVVGRIGGVRPA